MNHDLVSGLNGGLTGSNGIPGYEDVRRSVMENMRTTSMFASTPSVSTPSARRGGPGAGQVKKEKNQSQRQRQSISRGSTGQKGKGRKRKRRAEESEEEESEELSDLGESEDDMSEEDEEINIPSMTQSGRKVVKPAQFVPEPQVKKEPGAAKKGRGGNGGGNGKKTKKDNETCKRCGRGHSPKTNMIVFCDGCDRGWHQMCHDPMIRDDIVLDESKEWFCSECSEKRAKKAAAQARKSNTPSGTSTPKPKNWQEMTAPEKRQHLSSLPHYHLVDLLIAAKEAHPDIALTPLPSTPRINVHPQQPFPPSSASTLGLFSRSEANPSGQLNYIRKVPPGSTLPTSTAALSRQNSSTPRPRSAGPVYNAMAPPPQNTFTLSQPSQPQTNGKFGNSQAQLDGNGELDADGEREESMSPPPSPPYPKPGNGLMSRLKVDTEDDEWLVGSNGGAEEKAFSHLMFFDQGPGPGMGGLGMGGGIL